MGKVILSMLGYILGHVLGFFGFGVLLTFSKPESRPFVNLAGGVICMLLLGAYFYGFDLNYYLKLVLHSLAGGWLFINLLDASSKFRKK